MQGIPRTMLQLVGVACMLIAAKYEEVRSPLIPSCPMLVLPGKSSTCSSLPRAAGLEHNPRP